MAVNERQHFFELLNDFNTCMLVTLNKESPMLHSRPMQVAKVEPNGELWFITGKDTNKAQEIHQDDRVLLTFQEDRDRFISLAGRAKLVQDQNKLDELWEEPFRVWFPEGKDDPDIMLIQVQPEDAEYWDNDGLNKIRYGFQSTKSYIQRQQPEVRRPEQFGHVDFK